MKGHVLRNARLSADEGEITDIDELVDCGKSTHDHLVSDNDVTGQGRGVGQDVVVADDAVMSDMGVSHHQVVRTNLGHASSTFSATVDGGKFADLVAISDLEPGLFTVKFEVLRFSSDTCHGMNMVLGAECREALYLRPGVNDGSITDANIFFDDRIRADRDPGAKARIRMDDCGGMNCRCLHQSSLGTTDAVRIPSATTLPSTIALPLVFHMLIL